MTHPSTALSPHTRTRLVRTPVLLAAALAAALLPVAVATTASQAAVAHRATPGLAAGTVPSAATPYPNGVANRAEPSHLAPPGPRALRGYSRVYVDDFNSSLDPYLWFLFRGVPGGDPGGYFAPSHVAVSHGRLLIRTYKDPNYNDAWVSGGAGLYRIHPTYGAFFVRSRQTAIGADNVELLWPANNQWPPEIDFNETGVQRTESTWTVHYTNASDSTYYSNRHVDVTHWHTWGVIWTPTSITFTLDGHRWGPVVTSWSQIPHLPMALDLQQQAWCGVAPECPTTPSALVVDWVTVYERS